MHFLLIFRASNSQAVVDSVLVPSVSCFGGGGSTTGACPKSTKTRTEEEKAGILCPPHSSAIHFMRTCSYFLHRQRALSFSPPAAAAAAHRFLMHATRTQRFASSLVRRMFIRTSVLFYVHSGAYMGISSCACHGHSNNNIRGSMCRDTGPNSIWSNMW